MEAVPQHRVSHTGPQGLALQPWPQRCPDVTPCDFFLWGCVKHHGFVPPLATNLDDLKTRTAAVATSVKEDTFWMNSTIVLVWSVQQVEGT